MSSRMMNVGSDGHHLSRLDQQLDFSYSHREWAFTVNIYVSDDVCLSAS